MLGVFLFGVLIYLLIFTKIYHVKKVKTNGYYALYIPGHPNAFGRGYVYEHRYVVEQKIGRYLKRSEIIHHIDGDRLNNDVDNLELCDSIAIHKLNHRKTTSNLKLPFEKNISIECACGCGKIILKYDNHGRLRKYANGCNDRRKKKRERLSEKTFCKCGCGIEISKYDKYGRIKKFIPGHNSKHFFSKTEISVKTRLSLTTIINYFNNKKLRNKTVLIIEKFIIENYGKNYLRTKRKST